MNNNASITPRSILCGPTLKHAQDPNRLSHTLCGIPLREVEQWAGAHCHNTVTCEECVGEKYPLEDEEDETTEEIVKEEEKAPPVCEGEPPRKSFLAFLSRLFGKKS